MNILHYYPGCTLKTKMTALDVSARAAMRALGYELVEPAEWTCCGAEYPLTDEKIVGLAAPVRVLRQVRDEGGSELVTTCSFCFAVLRRSNEAMARDDVTKMRINAFLRDDVSIAQDTKTKRTDFLEYNGEVRILHLLEYLRDYVGFDRLKQAVRRDLNGIAVGAYYGCRLLRPYDELRLDDPENPSVFEGFLTAIGCTAVEFPLKQECCGSYLSVSAPEVATEAAYRVLDSALGNGARALVVTCPLCFYNLERRQDSIRDEHPDFPGLPVLYFTQLLAWALGAEKRELGLAEHRVAVETLFAAALS